MEREYIKQNATASGWCRENFHWYFLNGNLYIEGTGALDYVEDWTYFYDPPLTEYWKRNKPVIHPWKELIPEIRHIEIAHGCTELGLGCFEEHLGLESVIIPDSVRKIGLFAFSHCRQLQEVVLPERVEEIDDFAFHGCVTMTSVTLPESIRRIGRGAFDYCLALEDIYVPEHVGEIDKSVFCGVKHVTYHGELESETNWGALSRN